MCWHHLKPLSQTSLIVTIMIIFSACSSIPPKCEPIDISEISIETAIHPGQKVMVTADGYDILLKVTGYSDDQALKGIEIINGNKIEIDMDKITAICVPSGGSSSLSENLADTELAIMGTLIMLPGLPLMPYVLSEQKKYEEERKQVRNILDQDEKKYKGKIPTEIEAKLGKPSNKFRCRESGPPWLKQRSPWYIEVWEYPETKISKGKKYLYFDAKYKKLHSITDSLPKSCVAFIGETRDSTPEDVDNYEAWEQADAKEAPIRDELNFLLFANKAYLRGDFEASYRLLEDLLQSKHPQVREKARLYLKNHPSLLQGAKASFSKESFKQSKSDYGYSAREIEKRRLLIYKSIAPSIDYSEAEINYENIFGSNK